MHLQKLIQIRLPRHRVRLLIMRNVVDLMLVDELLSELPRRVGSDLVDPFTVLDGLASFGVSEGWKSFVGFAELIRADSDDEVDGGEAELGLSHLESVTVWFEDERKERR